ncbi:phosphoglycerate dehydrogenase [Propionivibrio dicarboxylicus]|uniref:D-3-phosphoglycerate dehydrogenase n=1 Tax=Propionivibrio dicarboxylicus TaxID=83767 RepID=A0A1G8M9C5_9RHOO|nr:phosphoglycerate dehydrogenase [Propionivibrio dicarboxylicus]SDI64566.1 D-3-phosphoglycerate dehydrogenase [Propionivibrio dicarboxylicus]
MTRKIQTLNSISKKGLARLPEGYTVANDIAAPDAILVRSQLMHDMAIADSVLCIGRAGAGTNNIPVKAMSDKGVVVFNAPGANANAVKELVIAGMLLGTRNLFPALRFVNGLVGDDESLLKQAEAGKKHFVGHELRGSTLGIIGLGAIGSQLAESAIQLGMNVVGYDPEITVDAAWRLPSQVRKATSVDDLVKRADFISLHVPLLPATKDLINAERIKLMKKGAILLNFSREGIVNDRAAFDGLNEGRLHAYVCDFPSNLLRSHPNFVALPHLGASTEEAEENCAIMVAEQVADYLENGNILNAVNFPNISMPRESAYRLAIANANVPNMLGQISTALAGAGLNIHNMVNKSRGDFAFTLVDVESAVPQTLIDQLKTIGGVLRVRYLPA